MAIDPETAGKMAPGFAPIALAKQLLRTARAGTLASLRPGGAPFASLVSLATDSDGTPLVLVSALSAHTRQIAADGRCSVLISRTGKGDPLAHPRLTLTCNAVAVDRDSETGSRVRRRFLARQPKAELYADFADFSFWRLEPDHAYLNGGFARAWDGPAAEILTPLASAEALVAAEDGALAHMNSDHAEAVHLYATKLCGAPKGPWRATGIDPEGMDLAWADRTLRLSFEAPVTGPDGLRRVLVDLAKQARAIA